MYTIQAIPTVYQGRRYRSRLEAKWAAFFDGLQWQYEYEPADLGPWSPDFAIIGKRGPIYVEVKPIYTLDQQVARKMAQCPGEHLLVGAAPFFDERNSFCGARIGWWCGGDNLWASEDGLTEQAEIARISREDKLSWGVISSQGSYADRITGYGNGDHHLCWSSKATQEILKFVWADAANQVQWHKPRKAR